MTTEQLIQQASYDALRETSPKLIAAIAATLRKGGKLNEIERSIDRAAKGSESRHAMVCAARYMAAHPDTWQVQR